jgi:hypothetical protein
MDIVAKLRSQVGDDIQHIFDHEALFTLAADEIERLRACFEKQDKEYEDACVEIAKLKTENGGLHAALARHQNY